MSMSSMSSTEPGPPWLSAARAELGVAETPGPLDTPRVLDYYRDAGHPDVSHDSVAWCAAFACAMLERSGIPSPRSLRAKRFLDWGQPLAAPRPGCLVVLTRSARESATGHVGFYVGARDGQILVLGGNQSDRVTIAAFPRAQLLGYRWPEQGAEPAVQTPLLDPESIFKSALAHVLAVEGGWSDDPHDPGGPTNQGITLAEFARWHGVDLTPDTVDGLKTRLRRIEPATVRQIYRANYWEPACCADLAPALALFHFDCAVNQGVGRAARFLQTALGVDVDGEIGPLTLAAAARADLARLIDIYAELRRAHYRALSHFWRFGRGWLNRVDAISTAALRLPMTLPPSSHQETRPMPTTPINPAQPKWWGRSLTVWGVILTTLTAVLPLIARAFGIDLPAETVEEFGTHLTTLLQALGSLIGIVMTLLGRARATQPLDLSVTPSAIPPFGPRNWRE